MSSPPRNQHGCCRIPSSSPYPLRCSQFTRLTHNYRRRHRSDCPSRGRTCKRESPNSRVPSGQAAKRPFCTFYRRWKVHFHHCRRLQTRFAPRRRGPRPHIPLPLLAAAAAAEFPSADDDDTAAGGTASPSERLLSHASSVTPPPPPATMPSARDTPRRPFVQISRSSISPVVVGFFIVVVVVGFFIVVDVVAVAA